MSPIRVVVLCVWTSGLCACGPPVAPRLIDLVPSHALAAVTIQWKAAKTHDMLSELTDVPPWTTGFGPIGFDATEVESVAVFVAWTPGLGTREAALILGRQVASRVVSAAGAAGWSAERVEGVTVYRQPDGRFAGGALTDDLLVVGDPGLVADAIKTTRLRLPSFTAREELREVRDQLSGTDPVELALAWPPLIQDTAKSAVVAAAGLVDLSGFTAAAGAIERLGIGRAFVVRLAPSASGLRMNMAAVMADEGSASLVAGGLSLMRGLASLLPSDSSMAGGPSDLHSLTVDRRNAVVLVGLDVPRRQ